MQLYCSHSCVQNSASIYNVTAIAFTCITIIASCALTSIS